MKMAKIDAEEVNNAIRKISAPHVDRTKTLRGKTKVCKSIELSLQLFNPKDDHEVCSTPNPSTSPDLCLDDIISPIGPRKTESPNCSKSPDMAGFKSFHPVLDDSKEGTEPLMDEQTPQKKCFL